MIPIWKDTIYTGTTGFEYTVECDGQTLAEGVLSLHPDGKVHFPINRIAENYLDSDIDFSTEINQQDNALRTFSLMSGYTQVASYDFIFDWSYSDVPAGNYILSHPINGHMDSRMKLMYSSYNNVPRNICYD